MTVLTAAAVLALVTNPACGNVPADSDLARHLVATVMTESGGDPFVIGINANDKRGLPAAKVSAPTAAEAAAKASALLAQGRTIDLGLAQINDRQMPRHHLTVGTAFDQCANLRAGAEHLADDHAWVLAHRRYQCGDTNCGIAYAQTVTARLQSSDQGQTQRHQTGPPKKIPSWASIFISPGSVRELVSSKR